MTEVLIALGLVTLGTNELVLTAKGWRCLGIAGPLTDPGQETN